MPPQPRSNGVVVYEFDDVENVMTLVITVHRSGAIDDVVFTLPCETDGLIED